MTIPLGAVEHECSAQLCAINRRRRCGNGARERQASHPQPVLCSSENPPRDTSHIRTAFSMFQYYLETDASLDPPALDQDNPPRSSLLRASDTSPLKKDGPQCHVRWQDASEGARTGLEDLAVESGIGGPVWGRSSPEIQSVGISTYAASRRLL